MPQVVRLERQIQIAMALLTVKSLRVYTQRLLPLRPWPVHNQGWTLIEIAVVAVITGILSSLAIPSMMGMMERNKLQATASRFKAVFQEAQRSAIRNGSTCTITITPTTVTGSPVGCITEPITSRDTTDKKIAIKTISGSAIADITSSYTVNFSYKGNTTSSRTFIITPNDIANDSTAKNRKCLVISLGIGIMRSGDWDYSTSPNRCTTAF